LLHSGLRWDFGKDGLLFIVRLVLLVAPLLAAKARGLI